jgi:hypothetical protein
MVMGLKSRYVSHSTYEKQKSAAKGNNTSAKKVTPKATPKTPTKTTKALPSAGNTSATKNTKRYFPKGEVSSRRAQAASKQVRAAQGTTGGNRTGQPSGSANRRFGANRVAASTRRAVRETALRNAGRTGLRILGKAGELLSGDGSGQLLMHAVTASNLIDAARGSTAKERNAKKKEDKAASKRKATGTKYQNAINATKYQSAINKTKAQAASKKAAAKPVAKPKAKPVAKPKAKPAAKPDNRSTLTKEIDGLTTFIATHKGKKGMKRALDQAAKRLAEKKKKRGSRSSLMSGNVKSNSTTG